MALKTITIEMSAYERLRKLRLPGDSFTDVLLRELPEPLETFGQVEDYFQKHGVPKGNPKMRKAMLAGRGRRSKRG